MNDLHGILAPAQFSSWGNINLCSLRGSSSPLRNVGSNVQRVEEFRSDCLHKFAQKLLSRVKPLHVTPCNLRENLNICSDLFEQPAVYYCTVSLQWKRIAPSSPHTSDYVCRSCRPYQRRSDEPKDWSAAKYRILETLTSSCDSAEPFHKNSTSLLIQLSEESRHEGIFDLPYSLPYSTKKTTISKTVI